MRIRAGAIPVPDQSAKLKPVDFSEVLLVVPKDCVLIGGQAVAWWAERYGIKAEVEGKEQEVTSRDIDFWGTAEDLRSIASRLKRIPVIPNRHEMNPSRRGHRTGSRRKEDLIGSSSRSAWSRQP